MSTINLSKGQRVDLRNLEKQIIDAGIYLPSVKKISESFVVADSGLKIRVNIKISARKRNKEDDLREQLEYLIERLS